MTLASPPRLHWATRSRQAEPAPSRLQPASAGPSPCRVLSGDNLNALACLRDDPAVRGQVTLAYLDPPFLTGREHFHTPRRKSSNPAPAEGSPHTEAPLSRRKSSRIAPAEGASPESTPGSTRAEAAFDDRWTNLGDYLDALEPRLRLVRELLAPHGSLVLHVDPKTSHYAKIICDELFGPECFASEVIWRYRRWPAKTPNFQRVHDVMLRYVKDPDVPPRFHQLYEPLAASTVATWGTTKQRAVTGQDGRRTRSSKTAEPTPGTPLGDVWEISIVAPVARERTGYPTQKPEALLARWIEALSSPGDLVLDPYMGSGTTLVAALRRGRRAIGVDQGEASLRVTRERLAREGFDFIEQRVVPRLRRVANPRVAEAVEVATSPLAEPARALG